MPLRKKLLHVPVFGELLRLLTELPYYAWWFFRCKLLGQRHPLQSVIFITDRCNLKCKHCNVVREGPYVSTMTYDEVREQLKFSYEAGSRIVDFEGGEPLLWRDRVRGADLNSLIDLAREIGFFSTTVTTNAQQPINIHPDLIWISIDGLEAEHDYQRGPGTFARAMKNIAESSHPNMNVNMTVTAHNWRDFPKVAELVKNHPKLNRLSFSFYVPYEDRGLIVPPEVRAEIIATAIALKQAGYPIMNSQAGMKLLRDPRSFADHRACWISNFVTSDGTRIMHCPGQDAGVCDECGFGMGPEMSLLFRLHPEMVLSGLKVRG
ncbi:MAG: radical SAM protein [Propionibacteriaceae bacterium]|jgi:MoaA/NifB/PqqE/SkfB family radical SAM enzyme|nr:radical SAM protein [Propionibacteriaceae bacterium]